MESLEVKNFAQINEAKIVFGDLTVLVGPQATGKSLILQWLKMAMDSGEVVNALKEAGDDVSTPENIIDVVFGQGMSGAWDAAKSSIIFNGEKIEPKKWGKKQRGRQKKEKKGEMFFIPAHRALLLAEGWPAPFQRLTPDTPAVARLFSQDLYQRFSGRRVKALFPIEKILKKQYRDLITQAVFHGGKVELHKDGLRNRLRLSFDQDGKNKNETSGLPFMTWTSGQREFTPLLLGLYNLLPSTRKSKHHDINWVVIEEPEMGLHPQAISVVMLLVLELLWRGYRVVVSTHSPVVLDMLWAIRGIASTSKDPKLLCEAFDVRKDGPNKEVMEHALTLKYRCYLLKIDKTFRVNSVDISELDPGSTSKDEAEWGGLTEFSSRFGEAVSAAVNEFEAGRSKK